MVVSKKLIDLAKKANISYEKFFAVLIGAYLLAILGWISFLKGNAADFFLFNAFSNKIYFLFIINFLLLWLARDKFNLKTYIIGCLLVLAAILLPLGNKINYGFFSFISYWQEAAWAWQRIIYLWILAIILWKIGWSIKIPGKVNNLLIGLVGIWFILMVWIGFKIHSALGTNAFDFGIYDQTLWNMAYKYSLSNSLNDLGHAFGAHFQPILILLVPFYWLWNDARMLFILETGIIALGAFPTFRIAKRKFENKAFSFSMVFFYLFFIGNQAALHYSFHPSTFLAPVLLFAYDFYERKEWFWHGVFVLLTLLVKENSGVYLAFFGIILLLNKKDWKRGLAYLGIGVVWLKMITGFVIPSFNNGNYNFFAYDALGKNIKEAAATVVRNPVYVLTVLFGSTGKVASILTLVGGAGLLAFFSSYGLLLLPTLGEKFLSSRPLLWGIGFHYGAAMAFGLVVAIVEGAAKFCELGLKKGFNKEKMLQFVCVLVLISTLPVFLNRSGMIGSALKSKFQFADYSKTINKIKGIIPDQAFISAQGNLVPQFSHRKEIYQFPNKINQADYVILQKNGNAWPLSKEELEVNITQFNTSKDWKKVFSEDELMVWQRKNDTGN